MGGHLWAHNGQSNALFKYMSLEFWGVNFTQPIFIYEFVCPYMRGAVAVEPHNASTTARQLQKKLETIITVISLENLRVTNTNLIKNLINTFSSTYELKSSI